MTLLVFGKRGQVATELMARAPEATFLAREDADLSDSPACAQAIRDIEPTAVINAAAWTAVDKAEENEDAALVINGGSPTAMARACAAMDVPFVHISTDYVFAGDGDAPWKPDDPMDPRNVYGRTKLAGEKGVRRAAGRYAILRTSWVFSSHGTNFVKSMLALSESRDALSIVGDQIGGPTPAADIADACLKMADQLLTRPASAGTYHFAGAPDVSWADFARAIFQMAGREVSVTDIPTTDYPTPAVRPLNSRMDCSELESVFGISRPDWREGLATVLSELGVTK